MYRKSEHGTIGILCLSLVLFSCGQEKKPEQTTATSRSEAAVIIPKTPPKQEINPQDVLAVIETDKGTMEMEFLPGAPKTVAHFVELVQKRFYNLGMIFFRVEEDVIQTGDPDNTGFGGSSKSVELEVWEGQMFKTGSVGMARSEEPESARSQFFICKSALPHLNEDYTLFGQIVSGLPVIQQIEKDDKMIKISLKPKLGSEEGP